MTTEAIDTPSSIGVAMSALPPGKFLTYARLYAPTSRKVFIEALHQVLDGILHKLASNADLYQPPKGDSEASRLHEKRLAAAVCLALEQHACRAGAESDERGHCDLVVRPGNPDLAWRWHGEAKIHRDYDYLAEGMRQILTRYANGIDVHAGLLVFIFNANANAVVAEWRVRVAAQKLLALVEDPTDDPLIHVTDETDRTREGLMRFCSTHTHEGTGNTLTVRHMGIALYFAPKDKSARGRTGPAKRRGPKSASRRKPGDPTA